jgi:hypothetical protein
MRRGLVLVLSPARLPANGRGDWPFSYELRGVSPCDEYGALNIGYAGWDTAAK